MRRKFLKDISLAVSGLAVGGSCIHRKTATGILHQNNPRLLLNNSNIHLHFGNERMIMPDGIQPYMLCTRKGTMILQASTIRKMPLPSSRPGMPPINLNTVISGNRGKTWEKFVFKNGVADPWVEGGITQLKSGKIILLDTYITPVDKPGKGEGALYYSEDDFKTVKGPLTVTFNIPGANYTNSSDDGGNKNETQRLNRRIIEMPNGDLLTTMYGHFEGDNIPSEYMPTMKKMRSALLRSVNGGLHWELVSIINPDSNYGTEGYGEPVLARITKGENTGRLICQMRTGHELVESFSDDEGKTWAKTYPRVFADINVKNTNLWEDMFKRFKRKEVMTDATPGDLVGAVVDPELLELRSGLLVAGFGVRIPHHACFENPQHPWNGNYMAISNDHGKTWGTVVQLTSGIPTTHYVAIEETPKDNEVFAAYDYGSWGRAKTRYVYGRTIKIII